MTNCRSCGAPIRWAVGYGTGKPMPLDAEPDPRAGTVSVQVEGPDVEALARVLKGDELMLARASGAALYVSHFATCPHAKRWRRD